MAKNNHTMNNVKAKPDVRDLIMEKMDNEGRTLTWLAGKINVNYNTLHSCLIKKTYDLSAERLKNINKALGTNFKSV